MTRRPIFIGVTAILALALTAGLAFGTGRLVGTRTPSNHSTRDQRIGVTGVAPGSYSNHRGQALQGPGYGSAFGSQMRGWIQDWMRNHGWNGQSWAGAGYGRQGGGAQSSGATSGGYSNGARTGYWDDHHATAGHRGPANGGYGYGGYGHGDDCW